MSTDRRIGWRLHFILFFFCGTALTAAESQAQGFGIFEQGGCQMGRAGAGVAETCADGSGIFFNPAGLGPEPGFTLTAGLTGIAAFGDFESDRGLTTDLDNDIIPVPHFFLRYGTGDRLALGIGGYVPYGLVTEWPQSFEGRFTSFESELQSFYLQPTAAFELNERIAVGGGLTFVVSSVELNSREDLSTVPVPPSLGLPPGTAFGDLGVPEGTDFAESELEASNATGLGGNFGVQVRATDTIRIGARYLTEVPIDYEGEASFERVPTGILLPPGNPFGLPAGTELDAALMASGLFGPDGPLADQGVRTTIDMPDQLVAGVSVAATDRLTILADYQWTNWSDFDRVPIEFENPATPDRVMIENYDDTSGVRVGAEYAFRDWHFRAGYIYNQGAAPPETVTPILPEGERNHVTAGASYRWSPRIEIHAAYQYLGQNDRRGRVVDPARGQPPTVELNSGIYGFRAHLFGTTVTVQF